MVRRGLTVLAFGLLSFAAWPTPARAQAQDINRYYHYPYYYFPQNYAPIYQRWPDQSQRFQQPPAYMAYPPYQDQNYRHDLFRPHRYYKGFHFWLDQF